MESETYKGYEIEIIHDECPENPFEAWDCEPPLAVSYDRDITSYATKYGDVNEIPSFTRQQLVTNLPAILAMTEYSSVFALARDYRYGSNAEDAVRQALQDEQDADAKAAKKRKFGGK